MMKGVLFDLDGVITDTAKFHFAAWSRLAKEELDVELPSSFETELKGVSRIDSMNRILKFANKTNDFSDDEVGIMAAKKNGVYLKEIEKLTSKDILPGIENLLDSLAANNVLLSVASASKNAPFILKKLGLFDRFDAIANPENVSNGKPAPDIFIEAAKQINVDPRECVGLEDAVAGVEAINASGAVSIGIGDAQELHEADTVVPVTSDLSFMLLDQTFGEYYKR
ncbi:beta-phosphoglucomutase [Pediococcus claussenii ATCC BAA-344]|uniref:Beta-phosphoglucomutase n=2 Tax=Pediococcus claussenii TaxID=187452 RepID=G8PBC3_PEDCP|nr:beta-phosphoglucomutase [Pediococcus claussenii ATCC BAA-344]KRN20517.1 pgmB protein [Pediococcus claussenii]